MSIGVQVLGNSGSDYAGSSVRHTLTQAYTLDEETQYVIVVVASSSAPDFSQATIAGETMDVLGLEENGGRLQVFGLDILNTPVASSGNISVTASASANNRSYMAWYGLTSVSVDTPVSPQTPVAGTISNINPTTEGAALVIGTDYSYSVSFLEADLSGASFIGKTNSSFVSGNNAQLGVCFRDSPVGIIDWDSDCLCYLVLDILGFVVKQVQLFPDSSLVLHPQEELP